MIEQKWAEWIDVSTGNKPNAGLLYYLSGIDNIYPANYNKKEIKKLLKECKNKAREIAGNRMTPYIKKSLGKKFSAWKKWALAHCQVEKAKVTYPIIPCKVAVVNDDVVLQVPVPYIGYGTKTEYGFTYNLDNMSYYVPGYAIKPLMTETGYDGQGKWVDGHMEIYNTGHILFTMKSKQFTIENKELYSMLG